MTPTLLTENYEQTALDKIELLDKELANHFLDKMIVNSDLSRTLVSFQGNKHESGYRWFKYKEGFSSTLVNYCFNKCGVRKNGEIIDPFAGSGATLFAARERGQSSTGIELLPIGCDIIKARISALENPKEISQIISTWISEKPWKKRSIPRTKFEHIRITKGAFPRDSEIMLERYLGALKTVKSNKAKSVLSLAVLSILEEISFTRKDGQYLRWDHRSGRTYGKKKFNKGEIKRFDTSITAKLHQILSDLTVKKTDLFSDREPKITPGKVKVMQGSCFEALPKLKSDQFDALMTSPPYCNRYDYTRTYALELALLGTNEEKIRHLRQQMLSCTVENKDKNDLSKMFSDKVLEQSTSIFNSQKLLNAICEHLVELREKKLLNNPGIARMVKNYFWETVPTLIESHRVLKHNAPFIMVNDNVRYAGIPISVDLILSKIAEDIGYEVEAIWILPTGKGNSSQQMGSHGREELRKCVYIWRVIKE